MLCLAGTLIPLATVAWPAGVAVAAQPAEAPAAPEEGATPAPDGAPLAAVVTAVRGKVRVRQGPNQALVPATAGLSVGEAAEILTGLDSAVELRIGAGQTYVIDRASRVVLGQALRRNGKDTTTLQVPYGRVVFEVQSTVVANDVRIEAPDATLAVKGTTGGIEVTPGQPTVAFGGELNTGVFNVIYAGGVTAKVEGQEQTDATNPDPADREQSGGIEDPLDPRAREGDEAGTLVDRPFNNPVLLPVQPPSQLPTDRDPTEFPPPGGGTLPPPAGVGGSLGGRGTAFAIVPQANQLEVVEFNSLGQVVGSRTVSFEDPGVILGSALRMDTLANRLEVVFAEIDFLGGGVTRIYTVPVTGSESPVSRTTLTGTLLYGLGTLGSSVFGIGESTSNPTGLATLYGVALAGGGGATPLMVPGLLDDPSTGMTGSNERGSVFVYGQIDPDPTNLDQPTVGALLEIDPRNRLLVSAYLATPDGALSIGPGTLVSPANIPPVNEIDVSTISILGGNLVATGFVEGQAGQYTGPVVLTFDPAANPPLRRAVGNALAFPAINSASENTAVAPPSPRLLTGPESFSLANIDPNFALMAYTTQARQSGYVERVVKRDILDRARDPVDCIASGALAQLPATLAQFDNHRFGVGLSVQQFRQAVAMQDPSHPCLPGPS